MSKVAITGNASGTGVFTVVSPNSNTDRVLTLPDESGTVDTLQRSGNVIQVVNFQTGAWASGTTIIPFDDTIPQITEGNEYMTLAITPTNENNRLMIHVVLNTDAGSNLRQGVALFQDAIVSALAASAQDTEGIQEILTLVHNMVAGTTSTITFRVRAGINSVGTFYLNAENAGRLFGGVAASSITITEYTP